MLGIVIVAYALLAATKYYIDDPIRTEVVPQTQTQDYTTDEARAWVIQGQFIVSLALKQYKLDPTPYSADVIRVMIMEYILILEALCVDTDLDFSCGQAYTFLDGVGTEVWKKDDE
jgi:hypothetical protein